jgi:hypothetical protein
MRDFAEIWQAADRIVYSKMLEAVSTARMRIERDFDPESVRQMKSLAGRDLMVGGPELTAQAFEGGLVEECHLFVAPMVVGGAKQSLPDNFRLKLELLDERRFRSGMVYLFYRTGTYPCFPSPEKDSRDLHKLGVWVCGENGREASRLSLGILSWAKERR